MVCCFLSSDQIGFSSKLQDDVLYLYEMFLPFTFESAPLLNLGPTDVFSEQ
jgi:hypothetical protein